jgi:hypothetical protein
MPQSKFTAEQAVEIAAACAAHQVEYLFIGKSGAILLGYPASTQDVDLFLPKDRENGARMIRALRLCARRPRREFVIASDSIPGGVGSRARPSSRSGPRESCNEVENFFGSV